jgi:hypothetical protein
MAKSELIYWEKGGYNEKASDAASISQFALWYLYIILTGIGFIGFNFSLLVTILCITLLHFAGLEDFLFYICAKRILLPDSYWKDQESLVILGVRLPKSLYWLSRPRKIGPITITNWLMIIAAGKDVKAWRFVVCVAVSLGLVVYLSFVI